MTPTKRPCPPCTGECQQGDYCPAADRPHADDGLSKYVGLGFALAVALVAGAWMLVELTPWP